MRINAFIPVLTILAGLFSFLFGGMLLSMTFYSLVVMISASAFYLYMVANWLSVTIHPYETVCYSGDTVRLSAEIDCPLPAFGVTVERISFGTLLGRTRGSITLDEYLAVEDDLRFITRGIYESGHFRITVTGIFGFLTRTFDVNTGDTLRVYPSLFPLNFMQTEGRDIYIEKESLRSVHENIYETAYATPYRQGDPIRKVHWKQSARQGELLVRRHDTISGEGLLVIADMCMSKPDSEALQIDEERIIDLAASVAYYSVISSVSISVHIIADRVYRYDIAAMTDFLLFHEEMLTFHTHGEGPFHGAAEEILQNTDSMTRVLVLSRHIHPEIEEFASSRGREDSVLSMALSAEHDNEEPYTAPPRVSFTSAVRFGEERLREVV